MDIRIDNTNFSGKWSNWAKWGKWKILNHSEQKSDMPVLPQLKADTFTRTTTTSPIDFKSIKKDRFLNSGREAHVYKTNKEDYVLRIVNDHKYIPEEMIPVEDGNGLILATNSDNTVQLLKYVKGEPLYSEGWNIFYPHISKDEYVETFNKIKNLPDESFAEFIRSLKNIREKGYDIDSFNPNNILLDGNHLHIVDIDKKPNVRNDIFMTDFVPVIDFFHMREMLSQMSKKEAKNLTDEIKSLFARFANIAKKEGCSLDTQLNLFSTSIDHVYKAAHT